MSGRIEIVAEFLRDSYPVPLLDLQVLHCGGLVMGLVCFDQFWGEGGVGFCLFLGLFGCLGVFLRVCIWLGWSGLGLK